MTADRVVLSVSDHRPDEQRTSGQFVELTEAGGVRLRPWSIRWAPPAELDAMAAAAGFELAERFADMDGRAVRRARRSSRVDLPALIGFEIACQSHVPRAHPRAGRPERARLRPAPRPGRRDPRLHRLGRVRGRRPPRLEPRRGRTDARAAPRLRVPDRRDPLGHRPPGLRPQDRHRTPIGLRDPSPGRRPLGLPEPRGVTARPDREQPRLDRAVVRRRFGLGARPRHERPAPHRRGRRRRRHDGRHGVRSAEQHGPPPTRCDRRPQRQRSVVRTDDLEPVRELAGLRRAGQPPVDPRPRDRAPVARAHRHPPEPRVRPSAAPTRGVPARAARSSATRRARRWRRSRPASASSSSRRRSSRRSAPATSVRSTGTTSSRWSTRSTTRSNCRPRAPIVVHVLTQKGRGYSPAEDDDEKNLHDAPVFDPLVGPPKAVSTGYTQAFAESIIKEAENDSRLVAITAAMPGPTGLLPFEARFPDRFFDVGIAEQHAVTSAAGMAMGGLRPVVAIYSTFLNRAWDQVVYDVAMHRLPVIFCLDRAGRDRARRRQPPRRVRHGAALEGARDARARPVECSGTRADAPRRDVARRRRTRRHPLPTWCRPAGVGARGRRRPQRPQGAGRVRCRVGGLRDRDRQDARDRREGGRQRSPTTASR